MRFGSESGFRVESISDGVSRGVSKAPLPRNLTGHGLNIEAYMFLKMYRFKNLACGGGGGL